MLLGNVTDLHGFRLLALVFNARNIRMHPLQIFASETFISSRTKW